MYEAGAKANNDTVPTYISIAKAQDAGWVKDEGNWVCPTCYKEQIGACNE